MPVMLGHHSPTAGDWLSPSCKSLTCRTSNADIVFESAMCATLCSLGLGNRNDCKRTGRGQNDLYSSVGPGSADVCSFVPAMIHGSK